MSNQTTRERALALVDAIRLIDGYKSVTGKVEVRLEAALIGAYKKGWADNDDFWKDADSTIYEDNPGNY